MEKPTFRSRFHKYGKITRAILARIILAGHGWLAIWVTGTQVDAKYYGLYAVSIPLFLLETGLIIYFRSGLELTRFCTSFFCYLLTIVPALWIQRQNVLDGNSTTGALNETASLLATPSANSTGNKVLDILNEQGVTSLLEQSMMFLIILCRWLLPRGRINRSSLSQLLIMYSAISADILDFSEIFDKTTLEYDDKDEYFRYIILGVWSWSLLQFTLVVTTSFSFHRRQSRQEGDQVNQNLDIVDLSETLSILMVFFMQDGPFLIARCYAIFRIGISNYLIIFFSLKNLLTLILGIFRLFVLCGCVTQEGNDLLSMEEVARSKESLDMIGMPENRNKNSRKLASRKQSLTSISGDKTNKKKKKHGDKYERY